MTSIRALPRLFWFFLAMTLLFMTFLASSARASFGVAGFDGESISDAAGDPYTQAGGHPFSASITMQFNETVDSQGHPVPDEAVRKIRVELPPGLVANPLATPTRCTEAELAFGTEASFTGLCPESAQVGTMTVDFAETLFTFPLYNMVPAEDEPAQLGARFITTDFHITSRVSATDDGYRVIAEVNDTSNALALLGSTITLWGVPAFSGHDGQRGKCGVPFSGSGLCPTDAPERPFVTLPTACTPPGVGLETRLAVESWLGNTDQASFLSHLPPGLPVPGPQQGPTGCGNVPFHPQISLQPTSHAADSPTGLHVDLTVPQAGLEVAGGIAASHLKGAIVELPPGMSINPASASGLGACTSAQIGLGNDAEANCPDSSKIGSLEIETPLLKDPVDGDVYLASQRDNPFGGLLAIYLVAKGPGVLIKLPGQVETRTNGQLVTTFDDSPQIPFSAMHLDFFGGSRAALRTPPSCGAYSSEATLVPWSGNAPVKRTDSFEITSGPNDEPCPKGAFAPRLTAGSSNPVAGAYSPLAFELTRKDGEQEINGLTLGLPKGLVGKLAGIPYCPNAALASISGAEGAGAQQIATPSCSAASRIGTVAAGAGAGSSPFFSDTGRIYLAGPYKGAPLSLAIVDPVVAGPFDLGSVLVRTALQVNPETAEIEAVSDPLPTILHGIPIDLRKLRASIDRPRFTLNPTGCEPKSIDGTATSSAGATAPLSERFQVGSCASLGFKPRLHLRLSGGTRRGAHPAFRAVLEARHGDANIGRASVALPHSEFLDQGHIGTVCTRVQFAAKQCPPASIYGRAVAKTPLLDQPLSGPIYLRSSSHKLPDLVLALRGQIDIDAVAHIDSANGGIRTTFNSVPDAPIDKVVVTMKGGKKGLLVNSRDICTHDYRATVKLDGQNGKIYDQRPTLKNRCGGKKRPG